MPTLATMREKKNQISGDSEYSEVLTKAQNEAQMPREPSKRLAPASPDLGQDGIDVDREIRRASDELKGSEPIADEQKRRDEVNRFNQSTLIVLDKSK